MMVAARRMIALLVLLAVLAPGLAEARTRVRVSTAPRAPSAPPLLGPNSVAPWGAFDESSASAPPSQGDVLAANGLESPLCRRPAELPAAARRNCRFARFVAGPYPTGDYAFDVNIDTGMAQWSNDASAVVQNFTQLAWMALVTVTHGLIVMFEWSYSLDLPGRELLGEAGRQLRAMGLAFTQPWLALALSLAAVATAYHGLIRRRVAQTLGQALATLAMMAAGLWLMLDPVGTVGGLQQWSDQAGVGVLSVAATGTSERPRRTLVAGLGDIFETVIGGPWCYMEFGDVAWCERPRLLDPRLRAAALGIAFRLARTAACRSGCAATGSPSGTADARGAAASALLLRQAQTNGQLFLALPANRAERNSVKTAHTLLSVLCGGGESASSCRGPTAAQAEFRSQNGTYSRAIGLLLIWAGALGMALLFGFLAVRLLICGVATIAYLLLVPAVVLAPALGENGRALFRGWATRLLQAALSKLTYSFVFGLTLALTAMLLRLAVLGWWAQWLLISAFWWTAFLARHRVLAGLPGPRRARAIRGARRRSFARRTRHAVGAPALGGGLSGGFGGGRD
jgi:hypothetical protein